MTSETRQNVWIISKISISLHIPFLRSTHFENASIAFLWQYYFKISMMKTLVRQRLICENGYTDLNYTLKYVPLAGDLDFLVLQTRYGNLVRIGNKWDSKRMWKLGALALPQGRLMHRSAPQRCPVIISCLSGWWKNMYWICRSHNPICRALNFLLTRAFVYWFMSGCKPGVISRYICNSK